ncbi:D-alanyl-D-alanine carboxypeptidase [Hyphomicrobium sulfonivorans]|uniref:D-alanyl-D-alanine carboxypeptidase n=1 Tax=Hyphomicrobium sulfonivorans TaxID=121290 RepID=A0A125NUQ9_HYPSL|nr:D-alanyl-D-alanine carboxypeptidase family protein [Hyphomicrobium sulfonivorans]KWT67408.1 D-alanyl-D-alanine carboxypeptidase [Hyphomicrobium sulfonivorans]
MRSGTAFVALMLIAMFASRPATAAPALVVEHTNSKVLYAEAADDLWHPASLTKIMTAYLVFGAIKEGKLTLKSRVTCSADAHVQPPSKIGLAVGGQLTVDKALESLIVKSANDVAVMLAEAVAGSTVAFVAKMNATAHRLGMSRTTFVNPNGLPAPGQVTTARDLAKLTRAVIDEFPEHAHYWGMSEMRLGKQRLTSHNGLLQSFDGADGFKTGFICDSGFNVVASATRDGRRIIAVVLGDVTSAERNIRAASLLEHGFQQPGWKQLFNSTTIDNMPLAPAVPVRSVRKDVTSWGCNPPPAKKRKPKPATVKAKDDGKKKEAKRAPRGDGGEPRPAPVTVEVETGSGDTSAIQLRGTMPPPAAAFQAPH